MCEMERRVLAELQMYLLDRKSKPVPDKIKTQKFMEILVTKYLDMKLHAMHTDQKNKLFNYIPNYFEEFKKKFPNEKSARVLIAWLSEVIDQEMLNIILLTWNDDEIKFNIYLSITNPSIWNATSSAFTKEL
uniref:CSON015006 protein n=1 Tax=Culicoides sonorensis TaxID=179676 RepID=A0A336KS71_CULSO